MSVSHHSNPCSHDWLVLDSFNFVPAVSKSHLVTKVDLCLGPQVRILCKGGPLLASSLQLNASLKAFTYQGHCTNLCFYDEYLHIESKYDTARKWHEASMKASSKHVVRNGHHITPFEYNGPKFDYCLSSHCTIRQRWIWMGDLDCSLHRQAAVCAWFTNEGLKLLYPSELSSDPKDYIDKNSRFTLQNLGADLPLSVSLSVTLVYSCIRTSLQTGLELLDIQVRWPGGCDLSVLVTCDPKDPWALSELCFSTSPCPVYLQ